MVIVTHLMNNEQCPLLQYIIKNSNDSERLIIFDIVDLFNLINLYCNVCHNTLYEGNEEALILIKKVNTGKVHKIPNLWTIGLFDIVCRDLRCF